MGWKGIGLKRPPGWEGFRARVGELQELLEELGVGYLFLKTVKAYPHADSNVDVLLPDPAEFRRAKEALIQRGFRPVFTWEFDKAMLLPPPPPTEAGSKPAVHLYSRISWYAVPYLDAGAVLRRGERVGWEGLKIPVPCPRDDFYIGALHAFFEEEALTLGDFWHLSHRRGERAGGEHEGDLSPAARWAVRAVEAALEALSVSLPPEDRAVDPQREREVVYRFPERVLLRGFARRAAEALRRRLLNDLGAVVYAYGLIHPAKRLKLIRG